MQAMYIITSGKYWKSPTRRIAVHLRATWADQTEIPLAAVLGDVDHLVPTLAAGYKTPRIS